MNYWSEDYPFHPVNLIYWKDQQDGDWNPLEFEFIRRANINYYGLRAHYYSYTYKKKKEFLCGNCESSIGLVRGYVCCNCGHDIV